MAGTLHLRSLSPIDSDLHFPLLLQISDSENEIRVKVLTSQIQLTEFAKKLQLFPCDIYDKIKLKWESGKLLLNNEEINIGEMGFSLNVANSSGTINLSFEIINPIQFKPGIRFKVSLYLEPSAINRLGSSLAAWSSSPLSDFTFTA